jgi:serine phosphatase RsbU (regulator of sigma subunit)
MNQDLVRSVRLFRSLPPEEIGYLTQVLRARQCSPGELLFREGDSADHFSIILEGQVEIIKGLKTPGERLLAVLGEGDYLGEMSLFTPSQERSASARARSQLRLAEIPYSQFEDLLSRQPALAFNFLREMSERIRNSENAIIRDLEERNRQLTQVYQELKVAQAQLVEKVKLEHELQVARRIQESILPRELPSPPGWQLACRWQPAQAVSGDYYDCLAFPDGSLGLLIADVSGKGVPAALVMATTRSILRAALHGDSQPGPLLARVNDLLYPDIPPNMFVTCFYALLESSTGRLRFANAGHPLPYLHASGATSELRATGMPLGLMPGMDYEEKEALFEPGASLLLYSDGCTEAHNPQGEMFGLERLRQFLAAHSAELDPIPFLLERLAAFTGPAWEQEDDITLISLRRCT